MWLGEGLVFRRIFLKNRSSNRIQIKEFRRQKAFTNFYNLDHKELNGKIQHNLNMESKRWIREYADIVNVRRRINIQPYTCVYRTAYTPVCNTPTYSCIPLGLSTHFTVSAYTRIQLFYVLLSVMPFSLRWQIGMSFYQLMVPGHYPHPTPPQSHGNSSKRPSPTQSQ